MLLALGPPAPSRPLDSDLKAEAAHGEQMGAKDAESRVFPVGMWSTGRMEGSVRALEQKEIHETHPGG